MCARMNTTYTISYGRANDCHAGRCRDISVSRSEWSVLIVGRAMEYAQSMKVGSLFSGIGGLDLGLERAGMDVIWQSEIDPYACKVLKKHWPTVPNLGNIKEIDWSQVERPDVICGGYPCQPFSTAGKRQGEGDARHLWPWVRECIAELRPRYAVLENVRGHLSLGFGTVLGDLATIGYDTEWQVIPAAAVGAPHRRDRVFIVAYAAEQGLQRPIGQVIKRQRDGLANGGQELADTDSNRRIYGQTELNATEGRIDAQRDIATSSADVANTDNNGLAATTLRGSTRKTADKQSTRQNNATNIEGRSSASRDVADTDSTSRQQQHQWQVQESNIGGCSETMADNEFIGDGQHRVTTDAAGEGGQWDDYGRGEADDDSRQWWAIEPDVGRVAHGIPNRVDRLRCLGNAVVPQVAEYVGRLIMAAQ